MKKASKKTASKKAAKKKPVSFDDVVDSAPGQVVPVSQAKDPVNPYTGEVSVMTIMENIQAGHDTFPEGMGETTEPVLVFHQLGTSPGDEEEGWETVESLEQALGLKTPQEPSVDAAGTFSQPSLETEPQTPSDAKETELVHVAGLPPFHPDDVDLPVISPVVPEMIEVLSETLRGFKWLYKKAKRKIHLLPEQQGELQEIYGDAERLLEQLKNLK